MEHQFFGSQLGNTSRLGTFLLVKAVDILIMSLSLSVPKVRWRRATHDYASLNRKGMQSLRTDKTKSRIKLLKNKKEVSSPGSGKWTVEEVDNHGKYSKHGKHVPGDSPHFSRHQGVNNEAIESIVTPSRAISECEAEVKGSAGSELQADMSSVFQIKMSMEQRKKVVWESIAELQRQIDEQQEDKELKQLMEEEARLQQLLAQPTGAAGKTGNNGNKCKSNINMQGSDIMSTLQELTGVKFDMSGFLDDNRPVAGKVNNALLVESQAKAGKSKPKKSRLSRGEMDEELEVEQSVSEEDSSDGEDDDNDQRRKKPAKKGNVRSGRYDTLSDTKLVSN